MTLSGCLLAFTLFTIIISAHMFDQIQQFINVIFQSILQVLFNTDENSALVKEVCWQSHTTIRVCIFSPACCCFAPSQCIEGVIGGADYDHSKVNQWTAGIVENSLTHLVKQGRAFKFIGEWVAWPAAANVLQLNAYVELCFALCVAVNCAIMQKSGAGLHTANSCYWDTTTDGRGQLGGGVIGHFRKHKHVFNCLCKNKAVIKKYKRMVQF